MSAKFELIAEPRAAKGTGASRRLRRSGKVPAILYGAGKEPMMVRWTTMRCRVIWRMKSFTTSILTVKVGGDTDQAILRDWYMHPYKPVVMHVDLQRISVPRRFT